MLAPGPFVAYAPDQAAADVLSRYITAHVRALAAHGNDPEWPQRAPAAFAAAALTDPRVVLNGFLFIQTSGQAPGPSPIGAAGSYTGRFVRI